MKKRFLSITLVLTIIISMLAGMAVSVGATPPQVLFYLDGSLTALTSGTTYTSASPGMSSVITAGSITVSGATLTMNNVTIVPVATASSEFVLKTNSLPTGLTATVELIGANTIKSPGGQASLQANCTDATSTLTIKNATGSTGSLIAQGSINVNTGNLAISGCTVSATGSSAFVGIYSARDTTISDSVVTVVGSDGFDTSGHFTIEGSTLTVTGNTGYGMFVGMDLSITGSDITVSTNSTEKEGMRVGSTLTITDSDVTVAATQYYAITVFGNISILDGSAVTSTAEYYGLYASNGLLTVDGSSVTVVSTHRTAIVASASGLGPDEFSPDGFVGSAQALTILNSSTVIATGLDVGIGCFGDMTVTDSAVDSTGHYGIIVTSGDLSVNSSTVIADATSSTKAALVLLRGIMASVDLNLGTGMIIKDQEVLASFSDGAETSGKAVAPTSTVTYENGVYTGASLHAVLCPLGDAVIETRNTSTIPQVTLPDEATLEDALLTDADRALLANGDDVDFDVVINSVQAPSDAQQVTAVLGQKTLALYLDISITKTIGETETAVHDLNHAITITFTIPEQFRGYDNYQLIRVHDGVATALQDLDTNPDTITFSSSQFSTYALVHFDSAPPLGDSSGSVPYEAAGMILALLCIVVCIKRYHAVRTSR